MEHDRRPWAVTTDDSVGEFGPHMSLEESKLEDGVNVRDCGKGNGAIEEGHGNCGLWIRTKGDRTYILGWQSNG